MDWRQALIGPELTLLEAMRHIDSTSLQVAIVVDDADKLLGVVTDGDIRRAILTGHPLDVAIEKVMSRDPLRVGPEVDRREALRKMLEYRVKVRHLPVVDASGKLIGVHFADDVMYASFVDNWVVLMAGGQGTRLRPLTETTPKPMLKVGPRPILETILRQFMSHGFRNFYISVNYMGEQIKNYFGDGSAFNAQIRYLHEDSPLGTAGALSFIPERPEIDILVANGDVLTTTDYRNFLEFHERSDAPITMAVREHEIQVPYGVAHLDSDRILSIEEKPTQKFSVNAGLYALSPEAWSMIPHDRAYDMPSLVEQVIAEGRKPAAYSVRDYWIDIGYPADFARANAEFGLFFR